MLVSDCCGEEARNHTVKYGGVDCEYNDEDSGICPLCHDHCCYVWVCDECGEDMDRDIGDICPTCLSKGVTGKEVKSEKRK